MAPRLLEVPPIYCSACYCQDPTKIHVDFQAENDQGYGDDPNNKVPYDWLFLCETCLASGARLIGMELASERDQEINELRVQNDRLKREAKQAQGYADRLEDAFEHRAQPIEVNHRKKPRKSLGPREKEIV